MGHPVLQVQVVQYLFIYLILYITTGRKQDADGKLKDWWTNQTSAAFNSRTQCIIDQYNGFFQTINGQDYHVGDIIIYSPQTQSGVIDELLLGYTYIAGGSGAVTQFIRP